METADLTAPRYAPYVDSLAFIGYDFTGATFKMQIAAAWNAGGALITLNTVTTDVQGLRISYVGTDTIANHLAAGRLSQDIVADLLTTENDATSANYELSDSVLLTTLALRIDKANMAGLPLIVDQDTVLYYDLHITPAGGDEQDFVGGKFTVQKGVVQ